MPRRLELLSSDGENELVPHTTNGFLLPDENAVLHLLVLRHVLPLELGHIVAEQKSNSSRRRPGHAKTSGQARLDVVSGE